MGRNGSQNKLGSCDQKAGSSIYKSKKNAPKAQSLVINDGKNTLIPVEKRKKDAIETQKQLQPEIKTIEKDLSKEGTPVGFSVEKCASSSVTTSADAISNVPAQFNYTALKSTISRAIPLREQISTDSALRLTSLESVNKISLLDSQETPRRSIQRQRATKLLLQHSESAAAIPTCGSPTAGFLILNQEKLCDSTPFLQQIVAEINLVDHGTRNQSEESFATVKSFLKYKPECKKEAIEERVVDVIIENPASVGSKTAKLTNDDRILKPSEFGKNDGNHEICTKAETCNIYASKITEHPTSPIAIEPQINKLESACIQNTNFDKSERLKSVGANQSSLSQKRFESYLALASSVSTPANSSRQRPGSESTRKNDYDVTPIRITLPLSKSPSSVPQAKNCNGLAASYTPKTARTPSPCHSEPIHHQDHVSHILGVGNASLINCKVLRKKFKNLMIETADLRLCKNYVSGFCPQGFDCKFIHASTSKNNRHLFECKIGLAKTPNSSELSSIKCSDVKFEKNCGNPYTHTKWIKTFYGEMLKSVFDKECYLFCCCGKHRSLTGPGYNNSSSINSRIKIGSTFSNLQSCFSESLNSATWDTGTKPQHYSAMPTSTFNSAVHKNFNNHSHSNSSNSFHNPQYNCDASFSSVGRPDYNNLQQHHLKKVQPAPGTQTHVYQQNHSINSAGEQKSNSGALCEAHSRAQNVLFNNRASLLSSNTDNRPNDLHHENATISGQTQVQAQNAAKMPRNYHLFQAASGRGCCQPGYLFNKNQNTTQKPSGLCEGSLATLDTNPVSQKIQITVPHANDFVDKVKEYDMYGSRNANLAQPNEIKPYSRPAQYPQFPKVGNQLRNQLLMQQQLAVSPTPSLTAEQRVPSTGRGITDDFLLLSSICSPGKPLMDDFLSQEIGMDEDVPEICLTPVGDGFTHGSIINGETSVHAAFSFAGNYVALSRDQHGCRYLQRALDDASNPTISAALWQKKDCSQLCKAMLDETLSVFSDLMVDPFANYLCQKLMEHATEAQKIQIIERISPDLVTIAINMHGTRSIQKLIVVATNSVPLTAKLQQVLRGILVSLVKDLNGNHVIRKCLMTWQSEDLQFIFDTLGSNCIEVATHRHGCCVLQRCLDRASAEQRLSLAYQIADNSLCLVPDPFGNYVVQYVLALPDSRIKIVPAIIEALVGHVAHLSAQKFSSNVIEKCLRVSTPDLRVRMLNELYQSHDVLSRLLRDSFANYVVQTSIDYITAEQHQMLVDCVKPLFPHIENTPYGKRIMAKLSLTES